MDASSIAEQLFFTTIPIRTQRANGSGIGTGFFFSATRDGKVYPFLVTNKHVVAGALRGVLRFTLSADGEQRKTPNLGSHTDFTIGDFEKAFNGHPDPDVDVTVMPLGPVINASQQQGRSIFFRSVAPELILPPDKVAELDAIEDVYFIGYPSGIWDTKNNLPVARRGTTATPYEVDFNGTKTFLIDASTFPGSSGSPVFLYNRGSWGSKTGGVIGGQRIAFLGILSSGFFRKDTGELKMVPIPTATGPGVVVKEMIDLGLVFKPSTVTDCVDQFLARIPVGATAQPPTAGQGVTGG